MLSRVSRAWYGSTIRLTQPDLLPALRTASGRAYSGINASRQRSQPSQTMRRTSPFSLEDDIKARAKTMQRQTLYFGGGLLLFFGTMYTTFSYVKGEPEIPEILPGEDVSNRYEHIATCYDRSVDSTEFWMGINRRRKKLLKQASGNVLEVSVGTGRNSKYYNVDQCQSITMVDKSAEMIEIARKAFKAAYPKYVHHKFIVQSALDPIAAPPGGYDTIVQTMGLCSTPDPVGLLKRMESVLKPGTGRILLLEHGRGYYDWILNENLDKSAARHAHKFGCWWNKDIESIIQESGLQVVKTKRYWFGTEWWIELKRKDVS